jgi:hypothetical protein
MTTKTSKTGRVRLSEADKAADTANYILNPASEKYVLRTSATGKKVVAAIEAGETVKKVLTKGPFAIAIIEALQAALPDALTNDVIATAIAAAEISLPRSFPKKWGGSGKAKSDSDKPTKARGAYNFFVKHEGPKLKEASPDENMMKLASAAWKKASASTKKKYKEMAAKDKKRYIDECEARGITASPSPSSKKPSKTNGYRVYFAEIKAANPEKTVKEIGADWKSKTDEEQAEYSAKADEINADFDERLASWQAENPGAVTRSKAAAKGPKPMKPYGEMSPKEQAKYDDPDNFIYNPASGRFVKRDSKTGKELVAKEDDGRFVDEATGAAENTVDPGNDDDLFEDA